MSSKFNRVVGTATLASAAAATATAITFGSNNAPCKVVRLVSITPTYTNAVNTTLYIMQGSADAILYQGSATARTTSLNSTCDVDVFPGDTIQVVTAADIGAGPCTMAITAQTEQ